MSGNGGARSATTAASLKRPPTPTKRRRGNSAGGGGLKLTTSTLDLREAIDSARYHYSSDQLFPLYLNAHFRSYSITYRQFSPQRTEQR